MVQRSAADVLKLVKDSNVEIVDVRPDCIVYQSGHPRKCRYQLGTGD